MASTYKKGEAVLTVASLRKAAAVHGAIVEQDYSDKWMVYQAVAPDGFVWSASSSVHLRIEWLASDKDYKQAVIADAIERMSYGLDPMTPEQADEAGQELN